MLFERMALSRKPEKLARKELNALRADGQWMPDMVFRDPYILDFLNLSDSYSERDLETAILRDIEAFLLEMGGGFSFVTRQKRMVIDGEVHALDLLFYHRRLRRLVAVELLCGRPHKRSSVAQPVMWRSANQAAIFAPFQYSNAT